MGASLVYLDKPNKEIEFSFGEKSNIMFCAGEMQGWRLNMVRKFFYTEKKELKGQLCYLPLKDLDSL
jgi:hypothetical protein